jgi:branched-subunit amino acid ABC-type transport system permease component
MEILLQQIINGLVLGSMYALIALGYTMVYGIINLINFAHGEVLMVGRSPVGPSSDSCRTPCPERPAG